MSLPLSDIVRIVVDLAPTARSRRGFNTSLFVGTSDVISTDDRVRLYGGMESMIEAGFTADMPEYQAASLHFAQRPRPQRIAIGRHELIEGAGEFEVTNDTAETVGAFVISWEHVPDAGNAFLYYTPFDLSALPAFQDTLDCPWAQIASGDEITPGTGATYIVVAEVDSSSRVVNLGAAALGGNSEPLDLPSAESVVDAIRACRRKTASWYTVTYLDATPDEIFDVAQYVETAQPHSAHLFTTNETLALSGNPNSIFNRLRQMSFRRTLGQYSNTPNAVAGIAGFAMGANTGLSRSAYTLMHKTVVGLAPDDVSETEYAFLVAANGNIYVSRSEGDTGDGSDYFMFEEGRMSDATWFDEILNLDMLVNDMQLAILDLFKSRSKVPQTEPGMSDIKISIKPSLRNAARSGFIAPGRWTGPNIFITEDYAPLQTGDILEKGWLVLSEPIDDQSQAGRDARVSPPIYVPIKLAGAIHTVLVQINVNR